MNNIATMRTALERVKRSGEHSRRNAKGKFDDVVIACSAYEAVLLALETPPTTAPIPGMNKTMTTEEIMAEMMSDLDKITEWNERAWTADEITEAEYIERDRVLVRLHTRVSYCSKELSK